VDAILLIGNDISIMEVVKSSLRKSFTMKDLGEATYIWGIKIYIVRSKRLIGLSQDACIEDLTGGRQSSTNSRYRPGDPARAN
jgi:hypothetical protein